MTELEEGKLLQTLDDIKSNTAACMSDRKRHEERLVKAIQDIAESLGDVGGRVTVLETKVWAIPTGIGLAGMFAGVFGFIYKLI